MSQMYLLYFMTIDIFKSEISWKTFVYNLSLASTMKLQNMNQKSFW